MNVTIMLYITRSALRLALARHSLVLFYHLQSGESLAYRNHSWPYWSFHSPTDITLKQIYCLRKPD